MSRRRIALAVVVRRVPRNRSRSVDSSFVGSRSRGVGGMDGCVSPGRITVDLRDNQVSEQRRAIGVDHGDAPVVMSPSPRLSHGPVCGPQVVDALHNRRLQPFLQEQGQ